MDLTTFIRPTPLPVSQTPQQGALAPALPVGGAGAGSPYIIVFLRHLGCPFSEITMLEVCRATDDYPDLKFVAVTQANWGQSGQWARLIAARADLHIVPDPDRTLYSAWGLGLSGWRHFAGVKPLTAVVDLYRETGIRNRHPVGTRWQLGGAFAVDGEGFVRFMHVDEHAGDPVDIDAAAASLRSGQRSLRTSA
jgi:hypothetical protein